jgi:predicted alpha/beta superfamily hydrolase
MPQTTTPDEQDITATNLDQNPRYLVLPDFHSRFLPEVRTLYIYLPEAYLTDPHRRFPVFYLHDGQNLIDPRLSFLPGHTWHAHTTADRLTAAGLIEPIILVGIANTGTRRMAEYTPNPDPELGGGEGPLYAKLLIDDLKPKIDADYRTLPDPANTALGGSSLGGLISLAIGLQYPNIFGKLAVMSPSIWWNNRSILRTVTEASPHPRPRIWLDMGTAEGLRHLRDADLLERRLILQGWKSGHDLRYLRVPGAHHNEDAWASRFGQVMEFLFSTNHP